MALPYFKLILFIIHVHEHLDKATLASSLDFTIAMFLVDVTMKRIDAPVQYYRVTPRNFLQPKKALDEQNSNSTFKTFKIVVGNSNLSPGGKGPKNTT